MNRIRKGLAALLAAVFFLGIGGVAQAVIGIPDDVPGSTLLYPFFTVNPNRTATDTQDTPGSLFVANWNGVTRGKAFATAQYSQKANHPRFGNSSLALKDSPFLTIGRVSPSGLEFNAPYFDRNDPEDRDNRQLTGSVSYFASRPGFGSHDLKAGVEWFDLIWRGALAYAGYAALSTITKMHAEIV